MAYTYTFTSIVDIEHLDITDIARGLVHQAECIA